MCLFIVLRNLYYVTLFFQTIEPKIQDEKQK